MMLGCFFSRGGLHLPGLLEYRSHGNTSQPTCKTMGWDKAIFHGSTIHQSDRLTDSAPCLFKRLFTQTGTVSQCDQLHVRLPLVI